MADMRSKLNDVYSLESLSRKHTCIHRLHPLSKMVVTIVYIVCIVSRGRYDLFAMAAFLFYPIIVMALAENPLFNDLEAGTHSTSFYIVYRDKQFNF